MSVEDWFVTSFPVVRLLAVPADLTVMTVVARVIWPRVPALLALLQGRAGLREMETSGDEAGRAEEVCRGIEGRVPGEDEDREALLPLPERVDVDLDWDGIMAGPFPCETSQRN